MLKTGLKLWSTNKEYFEEAKSLFKRKAFDYIELTVVPGSFADYIKIWETIDVPYIIHAPHLLFGMNLSKAKYREQNIKLLEDTMKFADKLHSKHIILHPGTDGYIEETASQIKKIYDPRMVIENKPYWGVIDKNSICVGNSPQEINFLKENLNIGFCLDMGHAVCSANAHEINPLSYIKEFLKINPEIFHLTDGDWEGYTDKHLHFGKGSFPLRELLALIPDNAYLTIETEKDFKKSLSDFIEDIDFLKNLH